MNFDRLRFVAERAELGERREAILAVTIPERPGSFREFCALLGKRSITEFNYRYADAQAAHIFVGIEVANRHETAELLRAMHKRRIEAYDLSDNEMAKLHVRHLVGGHAPDAENEILYRFEFPERPGALMRFLDSMSRGWNISLFHYRNHGADYGRVLVGMQVPPSDKARIRRVPAPAWATTASSENLATDDPALPAASVPWGADDRVTLQNAAHLWRQFAPPVLQIAQKPQVSRLLARIMLWSFACNHGKLCTRWHGISRRYSAPLDGRQRREHRFAGSGHIVRRESHGDRR